MIVREIDALVAEKVLGCHVQRHYFGGAVGRKGGEFIYADCGCTPPVHGDWGEMECGEILGYTTDIAAAWQVVEKLNAEGGCYSLINDDNGHWAMASDGIQNVPDGDDPADIATSFWVEKDLWADTAPMAICLAALKAVGCDLKTSDTSATPLAMSQCDAGVAESADAVDSKPIPARGAGSTPAPGTTQEGDNE
jgi:hypothetical protein